MANVSVIFCHGTGSIVSIHITGINSTLASDESEATGGAAASKGKWATRETTAADIRRAAAAVLRTSLRHWTLAGGSSR